MTTARIQEFRRHVGETVTVRGWIHNKRSSGKLQFLIVRDGSGYAQAVVSKKAVPGEAWDALEGGFIVAGRYDEVYNTTSFYLLKIDTQGDTLWTRKYGMGTDYRVFARAVEQTADGGYMIAGYVTEYISDYDDVYVVKTDSLGMMEWSSLYNWSNYDIAYGMKEIADGYVLVGLTHYQGEGRWNVFLYKTNSSGDSLWLKIYGDSLDDRGYAVKQTTDNGFIIAAWTSSWGAGSFDYYLIRTDSNGDTLWTRLFGGDSHEYAYDVIQTQDGGYAIAGSSFRLLKNAQIQGSKE